MHENFVGPKIKKAWGMKPKARAGNTNKRRTGGVSSDARLKVKNPKPQKEESKKR